MFTPRIGAARPWRSDPAWMSVPSPPRTTRRYALVLEEAPHEHRRLGRLGGGDLVDDPDAPRDGAGVTLHPDII
jgi:hypothetical protein